MRQAPQSCLYSTFRHVFLQNVFTGQVHNSLLYIGKHVSEISYFQLGSREYIAVPFSFHMPLLSNLLATLHLGALESTNLACSNRGGSHLRADTKVLSTCFKDPRISLFKSLETIIIVIAWSASKRDLFKPFCVPRSCFQDGIETSFVFSLVRPRSLNLAVTLSHALAL